MATARNLRTGLIAGAVACGMVGMGFAAVPLYRIFCQATGYGGTARIEQGAQAPGPSGRIVSVRFDANVSPRLAWRFEPEQKTQRVAVGARQLAFFDATNLTDKPLTGSAAFNVSPDQSAQYFVKVQCFCFTQQTLQPGETQRMPVVFYVDPGFSADPNNAGVREITLSYTFYPVDQKPFAG
ncbi:MAG TPA: cytochrome c oxidase assembly protein [Sphingomonas sp.]|nr:cytochrome c oxidase assembly protein [Sphingomonas sp.]